MHPKAFIGKNLSSICMIVQATVMLKVQPSDQLVETMKEFSKATQYAYDYALKNKINSWKILHQRTYRDIRKFSKLGSQLCCKAIKTAIETKKGCKNRKVNFSDELTIMYDQRSYSFDFSGNCSLSTIKGRHKCKLFIPEYYLRMYGDWDITSATLAKRGKELFLNVVVAKDISSGIIDQSSKIVGIDLGINNLATTSDFDFFKGVRGKIAGFQRLRSQLQSKGTESARKKFNKVSGAQKRFMRSVNHEISKRIVGKLNAGDVIVMEDLHGIRSRRKGKIMNRLLSNWAFSQLRVFIEYKAVRKGIIFSIISPAYTSKMCNRCHEINSIRPKKAGFFKCLNCGYSCNADLNASFNLRNRVDALRNTLGVFVNDPNVGNHNLSDKPTTLVVGN